MQDKKRKNDEFSFYEFGLGKANAAVDLRDGKITALRNHFNLDGLNVGHVLRDNNGFILSLDAKTLNTVLSEDGAAYVTTYTDATGEQHVFTEKYYVLLNEGGENEEKSYKRPSECVIDDEYQIWYPQTDADGKIADYQKVEYEVETESDLTLECLKSKTWFRHKFADEELKEDDLFRYSEEVSNYISTIKSLYEERDKLIGQFIFTDNVPAKVKTSAKFNAEINQKYLDYLSETKSLDEYQNNWSEDRNSDIAKLNKAIDANKDKSLYLNKVNSFRGFLLGKRSYPKTAEHQQGDYHVTVGAGEVGEGWATLWFADFYNDYLIEEVSNEYAKFSIKEIEYLANCETLNLFADSYNMETSSRKYRDSVFAKRKSIKNKENDITDFQNAEKEESLLESLEKITDQILKLEESLSLCIKNEKQKPINFVTYPDGQLFGFDFYGRLCAYCQNESALEEMLVQILRSDDGAAEQVVTGDGRVTEFIYNNDLLSAIRGSDGFTVKLSYPQNKTVFEDADGLTETYVFDTDGSLIKFTDSFGGGLDLTHTSGKLASIMEFDNAGNLGERLTFSYGASTGATIKGDKNFASFNFDAEGRTIFRCDTSAENDAEVIVYEGEEKVTEYVPLSHAEDLLREAAWVEDINNYSAPCIYEGEGYIYLEDPYLYSNRTFTSKNFTVSENLDGDCFMLWGRAIAPFAEKHEGAVKFEISARVNYKNNGGYKIFNAVFDHTKNGYQYAAVVIEPAEGKEISSIKVTADFTGNNGYAEFEEICLVKAKKRITELDGTKVTKVTDSEGVTEYVYDDRDLPEKAVFTDKDGNTFDAYWMFDGKKRLVTKKDFDGTVTEEIYDKEGRHLKTLTYHEDEPATALCEKYNEAADNDADAMAEGYSRSGELKEIAGSADGVKNSNIFKHKDGKLIEVFTDGFSVGYSNENFGKNTAITVNGSPYLTAVTEGGITTTTYATGESFAAQKDAKGRITKLTYKASEAASPAAMKDAAYSGAKESRIVETLTDGRVTEKTVSYFDDGSVKEFVNGDFGITADKEAERKVYTKGGAVIADYTFGYKTGIDKRLKTVSADGIFNQTVSYDGLGRLKGLETRNADGAAVAGRDIYYLQKDGYTTPLVSSLRYSAKGSYGDTLKYAYDEKGNIVSVKENGRFIAFYKYDGLGRLVREDNVPLNKTFVMEYDANGNLTSKYACAFTRKDELVEELYAAEVNTYTYGASGAWRDQLTSFNGEQCIYDALGNPKTYRGKEMKWSFGRCLTQYGADGDADKVTFVYDSDGIRVKKNNISYTLEGTKIISETENGRTVTYFYGADGIAGFSVDGAKYFYRKNLQGDITNIFDAEGNNVVEYKYDAWGTHSIEALGADEEDKTANLMIGRLNPFRYRGYYFDEETNLFYLNSRYYDPETGRFINADDISYLDPESINGLNLYAYCGNNPVMRVDPNGKAWWKFWEWDWKKIGGWIATAVVTVAAVVAVGVGTFVTGGLLGAVLVGAGIGAITGIVGSIQLQGGLSNIANIDPFKVLGTGLIGGIVGGITGALGYGLSVMGQAAGQMIGLSLASKPFLGLTIGKVFNSSILMSFGGTVGKIVGSIIGSMLGNHIGNLIFGKDKSFSELTSDTIKGEIPGWIQNFLKWIKVFG